MAYKIKPGRIEKFSRDSFSASWLEDGDRLWVGCTFKESAHCFINCDFESSQIQKIIRSSEKNAAEYRGVSQAVTLLLHAPIDPKLLSLLWGMAAALKPVYEESLLFRVDGETYDRGKTILFHLIGSRGNEVLLSELLELNMGACAELSAVAQYLLERNGFHSLFFSGWMKTSANGGSDERMPHAWVLLPGKECDLAFNPSQGISSKNWGYVPGVYRLERRFIDAMRDPKGPEYVKGTSIYGENLGKYGSLWFGRGHAGFPDALD